MTHTAAPRSAEPGWKTQDFGSEAFAGWIGFVRKNGILKQFLMILLLVS